MCIGVSPTLQADVVYLSDSTEITGASSGRRLAEAHKGLRAMLAPASTRLPPSSIQNTESRCSRSRSLRWMIAADIPWATNSSMKMTKAAAMATVPSSRAQHLDYARRCRR